MKKLFSSLCIAAFLTALLIASGHAHTDTLTETKHDCPLCIFMLACSDTPTPAIEPVCEPVVTGTIVPPLCTGFANLLIFYLPDIHAPPSSA